MQRACVWVVGASLFGLTSGCGAPPPPPEPPPQPAAEAPKHEPVPAIEGDVGGMNETRTEQTIERVTPKLVSCYQQGLTRVAYLAGEVQFAVRVAIDGSTRSAFVKATTLGDRETELCMLGVLKATTWPKPVGGEGTVESPFTFNPSGDTQPAVDWTPDKLGPAFRGAKYKLGQCKKKAGTKKKLKATMYVDTDGTLSAVGVGSEDEKGEAAVDCVIETLKSLKYKKPGDTASKVTVTID